MAFVSNERLIDTDGGLINSEGSIAASDSSIQRPAAATCN